MSDHTDTVRLHPNQMSSDLREKQFMSNQILCLHKPEGGLAVSIRIITPSFSTLQLHAKKLMTYC